jgi:hypothetical protein
VELLHGLRPIGEPLSTSSRISLPQVGTLPLPPLIHR